MSNTPFMPLWVSDFIGDTTDLDATETGAYLMLIMAQWQRAGCSLPADQNKLQRIARCGRSWPKTWAAIARYFEKDADGYFNTRARVVYQNVTLKRIVNSQSGAHGGRAKALKNNDTDLANATNSLKRKATIPEPYPDIEKEDAIASKKKPNLPLPDGWVPNDKNLSDARSKNMTDGEIEDAATEFANYHHKHDNRYRDWNAAWRTWLGNRNKYSKPHATTEAIAIAARFARSPSEDSF